MQSKVINLIFQIARMHRHHRQENVIIVLCKQERALRLQFPFITRVSRLSPTQNPDKLAAELRTRLRPVSIPVFVRQCKRQSCRRSRRQTLIGLVWALPYAMATLLCLSVEIIKNYDYD